MRDSIESINEALVTYDNDPNFGVRDVQAYLQAQGWVYQPQPAEDIEPIQALDAAVQHFADQIDDNKAVSGWVLGYSYTVITPQEGVLPLRSGMSYTSGPGTLMTDALGLSMGLQTIFAAWATEEHL